MKSGAGAAAAAYHDQDDIDDALDAWSDDDVIRMTGRAKVAALGTDLECGDVLGEAVRLVLSGKRPWKVGVPFDAHMTMVMRSIGSNRRRHLATSPVLSGCTGDEDRPGLADGSLISTLRARQLEADVSELFKDDPEAWAVFQGRLVENMPVEDACELAEIPRDQYETVLKRVRRKLAKAVETGAIR